jgi:hypothetical protein
MEDKQIEELLRESWQPEPPDGMRKRVMNRARRELRPRWFFLPRLALPRWQAAFALAAAVIMLACGISNSARENRLAALENRDSLQGCVIVAQRPATLGESRLRLARLMEDPDSNLTAP